MLKLLRCWLRAGVFEGGVVSDTEAGTPQGSPISPLLANIALHVLDEAWATTAAGWGCWSGTPTTSSCSAASRQRAEEARRRVAAVLAALGLRLHPDKTRIVLPHRGRGGLRLLGLPPPQGGVLEVARSLLPATSGRRHGRCTRSGPRSVTAPTAASPAATCTIVVGRPQPRAAGLGALLPATATPPGSSPPSTATSTSGWPIWPASSTASEDRTGPAGSTTPGSTRSASTGSSEPSRYGTAHA